MGIMSSSVSITRYKVKGKLQKPILESVLSGLEGNCITEIDNKLSDKSTGWTCFDDPFNSDFERSHFLIGTNIVFSLRIDKKNIPAKMINKAFAIEANLRLKKNGRDFLSKREKKDVKDYVLHHLSLKVPSIPKIHDVVWQYEEEKLLFFSNSKSPNEELENLFYRSFNVSLVRLFPLTMVEITPNILVNISPTNFTRRVTS